MKKIIALTLCFVMLFSITSFSAVDDAYKEVLQIVKQRIGATDEYDDFSANQRLDGTTKIFSFSWTNTKTNERLNIEALENGVIIRLNKSFNEVESDKAMLDISKEEALEKAIVAFNKLNPDIKDQVVITNSSETKTLWETRQYFNVQRIKNGIEVVGDTGYIEMDEDADEILWYYINWGNYEHFENVDNAISLENAKEIYAAELGLCLTYKMRIVDKKKEAYLVYTIKEDTNMYVDFSGNIIKCNPYAIYYAGGSGALKNEAVMEDSMLSKAEMSEIEKLDGLLSKEEVEKTILNMKLLGLEGFSAVYASLTRDYYEKDKYIYSFNYKKDNMNASVTVDAKNGEILNFYKYVPNKADEEKVAAESVKNVLKEATILCKTNFEEYELVKGEEYSDTYYRMVDGVRFINDSINISVDEYTGELKSYSKNYSPLEFPSKENVISPNMAYKCAYDLFSYGLRYIPAYNEETKKTEVKLVFAFKDTNFDIDAFTGENNIKDRSKIEYKDIETHYAKDYIKALAEYGIGIGNNEFYPDAEIKQKEYISLLVKVFYRYYASYEDDENKIDEFYSTAVREGIIEKNEIDYEKSISRHQAAKYLINALGYKKLAQSDNIFNCPFSDVTENKASITMLYGLGIVAGDGQGNFNPDSNLLRGDTMIMLYKYLSK